MLREGKLEDREVDMVVNRHQQMPSMEIIAGGSIDDLQNSMQGIMNMITVVVALKNVLFQFVKLVKSLLKKLWMEWLIMTKLLI